MRTTDVVEDQDVLQSDDKSPTPPGNAKPVATRDKKRLREDITQNKVVLFACVAIGVALLLFLFSSKQTHKQPAVIKPPSAQTKPGDNTQASEPSKTTSPFSNSPGTGQQDPDRDVSEEDVLRTATHQPSSAPAAALPKGTTLGSVPPFDSQPNTWQAPPYHPAITNADVQRDSPKTGPDQEQSLVFVRKSIQGEPSASSALAGGLEPIGLNLAPGSRLRARLETSASTAVRMPVIALVEYNYESNREIVIPAGSRCFGHIEEADRSGLVSIRFDSLIQPDGSSMALDAVATDLNLGPLKGKVHGKNNGKNIAVRSVSGLGQVGALLVGRGGNFNQPFSEADLLRERLSNNVGTAADQELTKLNMTEHIVVSLSANTPLYVVLDRGTRTENSAQESLARRTPASQMESLRQLLQLQRELNETAAASQH